VTKPAGAARTRPPGPVRVWQLAERAGLSSRETRERLDMLGWPTSSHASSVPSEAAETFLAVVQPLPPAPPHVPGNRYLRLLGYVRTRARGWTLILSLTLAGSLVSLAAPWPLKLLIDDVLTQRRAPRWAGFLGHQLTLAILLLAGASVVCFAVGILLELLLARLGIRVGQGMVLQLAGDVLAQLQRQSLAFHGRSPVGDSMRRVMGDSYGLGGLIETLLFGPLHAAVLSVLTITVLLRLDAPLTLAAVTVSLLITATSRAYGKAIERTSRASHDATGMVQTHVHQVLSGLPVVQSFGQQDRELAEFRRLTRDTIRLERRGALLGSVNGLGSGLAGAVGGAAVLWLAAGRVLDGKLTIGSLLVFLTYLGTLRGQAGVFAGIYPSVQGSRGGVDRVLEVLDAAPDVRDRPGARALNKVRGHLAFTGVTFGYDPQRPVLQDVTFEARPGETIALVGPSGAGKTTLASLLPRFYDPDSGNVLLDGHDLRDLSLRSLRDNVSLVLQEPFLFPISIADNIAYGRPDATPAQIRQAARDANAHTFITELPNDYDTVVGERGATLSGGQRQRISIARALLKDAPLLVLDEPTSALDTHSEHLLLQALDRLMAGRTTLIIAHRLSTIRHADQILVLDNGRIIERGTHTALVRLGGAYAATVAISRRRVPARRSGLLVR